MSEFYRLRIDEISGLHVNRLLEVCGSVQHVIVRHELPHGNPHYHAYIKTEIKQANLRKKIKTLFPEIQKTDYSLKACDEQRINEYVQYMFNTKHGNKWELIDTLNYDDTALSVAMESAKKISTDYTETHVKKRDTGPTIWDLAQELEQKVKDRPLKLNQFDTDWITTYTNEAIAIMRNHRKPFDEFLLRKIITTAMSSTEKGRDIMRYKMLKQFSML